METACEYMDDRVMRVSTDEKKWKTRFLKWAEEYPEEVEIIAKPEENDGCLYLKCPASWLRMRPPIKRNLTEEQRQAISERMRKTKSEEEERDEIEDEMEEEENE